MAPCLHPSLQRSVRAAPWTPLECLEMIFSVQRTHLYGSFIFISPPVQMLMGQHSSTRVPQHRHWGLPAPSTAQHSSGGRMDRSCRSAQFAKSFRVAACDRSCFSLGWLGALFDFANSASFYFLVLGGGLPGGCWETCHKPKVSAWKCLFLSDFGQINSQLTPSNDSRQLPLGQVGGGDVGSTWALDGAGCR